ARRLLRLHQDLRQGRARARSRRRHRGRAAGRHGHRPGAGDQGRARAGRPQAFGYRSLRDQRSLRRASDGVHARTRHRRGQAQRQRRRHRHRPSLGRDRRAARAHAGTRAQARAPALRRRLGLHRRRPGHRAPHRESRPPIPTEELTMDIKGHAAIVTGGASGLGTATASELARAGARVTCLDVNLDGARAVAEKIGGEALYCDVTHAEQAAAALAETRDKNGPAKRTVGRDGPMPLADFERVIDINLVGTFNMMRLVAADMQSVSPLADGERGVIIMTASVAAFEGQIGQAAYSASKGGIAALTLPAAREFAQFGIRVNAIAPGIFHTPMLMALPEEAQKNLAAAVPFPKLLGRPDQFASLAHHIIENTYINGEVIRLDGALRLAPR